MKMFAITMAVLFFSCLTWAQNGSDIPPPPMPEYMKKHKFKAPPPPPPAKNKLQSPAMDLNPTASAKKETKFLESKNNDTKAFLKKDVQASQPVKDKKSDRTPSDEKSKSKSLAAQSRVDEVDKSLVENQEDDEDSYEAIEPIADTPSPDLNEVAAPDIELIQNEEATLENAQNNYLNDASIDEKTVANETLKNTNANTTEPSANLAEVESQLESEEEEHEKTLTSGRIVAGDKKFKAGMYKFNSDCMMRADASNLSEEAGKIRSGQKLWIDAHDTSWHKVYKKTGAVYIPADCLK